MKSNILTFSFILGVAIGFVAVFSCRRFLVVAPTLSSMTRLGLVCVWCEVRLQGRSHRELSSTSSTVQLP